MSQLEENLGAVNVELIHEDLLRLDQVSALPVELGLVH